MLWSYIATRGQSWQVYWKWALQGDLRLEAGGGTTPGMLPLIHPASSAWPLRPTVFSFGSVQPHRLLLLFPPMWFHKHIMFHTYWSLHRDFPSAFSSLPVYPDWPILPPAWSYPFVRSPQWNSLVTFLSQLILCFLTKFIHASLLVKNTSVALWIFFTWSALPLDHNHLESRDFVTGTSYPRS